MSILGGHNRKCEQRIKAAIENEYELTRNNGRDQLLDFELLDIHTELETMMGKIKSAINNVKEDSVKEDLERVLSFLQMFDERNQLVQKTALYLSRCIAHGTIGYGENIKDGFETLKKLEPIVFQEINEIVAELHVELP